MISTWKVFFHDWSIRYRPAFHQLYHDRAVEILPNIQDLTGMLPLLSNELNGYSNKIYHRHHGSPRELHLFQGSYTEKEQFRCFFFSVLRNNILTSEWANYFQISQLGITFIHQTILKAWKPELKSSMCQFLWLMSPFGITYHYLHSFLFSSQNARKNGLLFCS